MKSTGKTTIKSTRCRKSRAAAILETSRIFNNSAANWSRSSIAFLSVAQYASSGFDHQTKSRTIESRDAFCSLEAYLFTCVTAAARASLIICSSELSVVTEFILLPFLAPAAAISNLSAFWRELIASSRRHQQTMSRIPSGAALEMRV